jgi:hypothetical protein
MIIAVPFAPNIWVLIVLSLPALLQPSGTAPRQRR